MNMDEEQEQQELLFLKGSMLRRLEIFRPHLMEHPHLLPVLEILLERYQAAATRQELRELQGIAASLTTAIDWQSPSFLHSLRCQAGVQEGQIVGTVNDYKRDQNLDAAAFEIAFAKEYIDAPLRLGPSVYATASGMAAFTTILMFLQHGGKTDGTIIVGQNSYFENKGLLKKAFPNRLHFVDEMDTFGILEAVKIYQPSVIFLDTLSNTEAMAMPNLAELLPALQRTVRRHTYIVLDNSCLGPMYQPLHDFPRLSFKLHLIVFESLNKFYQFGFDRLTGGIIWGVGNDTLGLMSMRTHLGTNIADTSARALPEPNRQILKRRLERIGGNAQRVAAALEAHLRSRLNSPLSQVTYPGLPSYLGYPWTKDLHFHGAFLVLNFKSARATVAVAKHFLSVAIAEAKKAKVELIAGTSFGFDVTRIYLTALKAQKDAQPFLRIAVGTEPRCELDKLIMVFKRAIDQL